MTGVTSLQQLLAVSLTCVKRDAVATAQGVRKARWFRQQGRWSNVWQQPLQRVHTDAVSWWPMRTAATWAVVVNWFQDWTAPLAQHYLSLYVWSEALCCTHWHACCTL